MTPHSEDIYNDGDLFFNALLTDIQQAMKTIEIEIYLFHFDQIGQQIIQQLILAAQRGVQIRILVDGIGSPHWGGRIVKKLDQAGIASKIFHPLPWRLSQFSRAVSKRHLISNFIHFIININSRNHRKVIMIDERITYIGSHNIDQRHLSKQSGGLAWRDTTIRLINAPIQQLKHSFETSWGLPKHLLERIQKRFTAIDTSAIIRLNDSRHQRRILYKHLLKRIARAKTRIWITNAYFIPDHFLLKKLKDAAKKGVDVRILLPQISDVPVMPWASEVFYQALKQAGVRIFEYMPSMLHAKTLIIDSWVMVGTSNLNHRSLLHDLEVDVALKSADCRQQVINQFHQDLKFSQEITDPMQQRRPWFKRVIGRIIMVLKFMI